MIEQVSTSVKFIAFFTATKAGKTGLTDVTVDAYDPSGTQIVSAASATEIGSGLYSYTLSSNNSTTGEYVAVFKTADADVDLQHIPSLWVLGRAGVENLDASVSSRSTLVTGDLPSVPSVSEIRTELDANSTKLANLDAAISTRSTLTTGDLPTVPTAAANATAVRTELGTELARIDATVSSRLADADFVSPDNASIAAVKSTTDALDTTRLANVATTSIVGTLIAQANS